MTELGYLGRYRQGQEVPVLVRTVNGVVPAWPTVEAFSLDDADLENGPVLTLSTPAGVAVLSAKMAAVPAEGVGTFRLSPFLGFGFEAAGRYGAVVRYVASGGAHRLLAGSFEVVAGGDRKGAVVAACAVRRPGVNYVAYQSDGGYLARGKNPR
jgi:hypothetical protein